MINPLSRYVLISHFLIPLFLITVTVFIPVWFYPHTPNIKYLHDFIVLISMMSGVKLLSLLNESIHS